MTPHPCDADAIALLRVDVERIAIDLVHQSALDGENPAKYLAIAQQVRDRIKEKLSWYHPSFSDQMIDVFDDAILAEGRRVLVHGFVQGGEA